MNIPADLLYSSDHEWIKIEGDTATLGITDYAQSELGDIVMIEFETGTDEVNKGDSLGTLEAVKTVSDVFAPLSGTVLEVNGDLEAEPEKINTDPYGAGWIARIKLNNPDEKNQLLNAQQYSDLAE
ncbi:MAG: glycine cleavage system protein GcvH [Candidatus Delongbacteria bacterium]|nr:glycine cleavage system protein GcvH [bacterium]MBL7032673.1 glycine cleavage system protein GcvH [Candidatus Delongbacteria bacterium]